MNIEKKNVLFSGFSVALLILLCISIVPITFQNDTYYTIKIGEYIDQNGIDMQDPFSWHEDLAYTYPHWLYDLITYKVYSIGGLTGVYILTIVLSCVLGIALYFVLSKLSKSRILGFFIATMTIYLLQQYIAARAQLVTYILFILTIYFIEKYIENKKKRYAVALIVTSIIIANVHCAVWPFFFIIFLPYIAEYILAILFNQKRIKKSQIRDIQKDINRIKKKASTPEIEESILKKNAEIDKINKEILEIEDEDIYLFDKIVIKKKENVKSLIIIMIICMFTGLLTPLGSVPYTYLIKTMLGNTTHYISEHTATTLIYNGSAFVFMFFFYVFFAFSKVKFRISDLFLVAGMTLLALMSQRQTSLLVLLGSVVLVRMFYNIITYKNPIPYSEIESKVLKTQFVYIFMIIVVTGLANSFLNLRTTESYVDETSYPVEACDYILENIDLDTARFFNEYNYGSYMIYRGIPVFIDSRADLYAPEFSGLEDDIFLDFIELSSLELDYEEVFDKYGITHVILIKDSELYYVISHLGEDSGYNQLYSDDYFAIYERI